MNTSILRALIAFALLAARPAIAGQDPGPIGKAPIPFYTGNLSVSPFMIYWGTSKGPVDDLVTPTRIALLKRIGVFADCDYQAWCLAEPEQGKWDFSMYRANADALKAEGLGYVPFSWVHFPPRWYQALPEFEPYRCAEHEEPLRQLSPWGAKTLDLYRAFYTRQHAAMGDRVGWIRVGTPSDYGEIGYPAAMTSWLVPQAHAHAGYWCGGQRARADFRAEMRRLFPDLAGLNRRWGTAFGAWDQVDYPVLVAEQGAARARATGAAADRRRWLDFADWYAGVWLRFVPKLVGVIRESYPTNPLVASVGYASELTCFGNDYSAIPKMARRIGIALQTPGNVSYYGVKRVSTACHHYGTPFYTEPPGDVPPEAEIARVFCDISNGVQVYFEYPLNLDRVRGPMREYKAHMTGKRPEVDVAIFHPAVEHKLNGGANNFPLNPFLLGEQGRDRFDFDVVDESLIADGALARYRVLVYVAGKVTERTALKRIAAWVRAGGVLLTCELGDVETVERDRAPWRALVPAVAAPADACRPGGAWDWAAVARRCVRRLGRGAVVRLPAAPDDRPALIDAVTTAAYDLGRIVAGKPSAPLIDAEADGLQATLLPDRILYFNPGARPITRRLALRESDWAGRPRRPADMNPALTVAPHAIGAVLLR